MKRYLIFAAVGPFIGGLLLLFVTAYQSGYWEQTNLAEVGKLFLVFVKSLQYSYLFGIVPALMIGSIDDILYHVRRIKPRSSHRAHRARGIRRRDVPLRLARIGQRRLAAGALRLGRIGAGRAVVLAGA